MTTGNAVPHSLEAEQALLGCALLDPRALVAAAESVTDHDFYRGEHRILFRAMMKLSRRGEPVDLITVVKELGDNLAQVGGAGFVAGLADVIPTMGNVSAYATIVRDDSRRRRLLALAGDISTRCLKGENPGDLVDLILRTVDVTTTKRTCRPPAVMPITINDFLAREFPPRKSLLAPWLPSQGLVMVYAYRGIGKTHFALGVAYACVSCGMYLGWQAPAAVGVLYIDGEMPGPVMQERLSAIITSNEREPAAPFILLTPDLQPEGMPRIDTDEGQAAIESVLTDEIRLIIVDNISTLSSARENEADGWTPVQAWALKQRAMGRSVLFVHHSGKGGAQRGTSRREDVLDTVIALRRPVDYEPDQGAVFEVHFEKARGVYGDDVRPIEARLCTDDDGVMTWETRTVEDSTFDRVVELMNDGLTQKDVATELNINKSTVSRSVKKAEGLGLIKVKNRAPRQIAKGNTDGWHEPAEGGL